MTPAREAGQAAGPPSSSPRSKFTSRAAVLVVVICAIALSLAYPVREYIAERRQIDQLVAQNAQIASQVRRLQAEQRRLSSPAYIAQQARDQLHMCYPTQACYIAVGPSRPSATAGPGTTVAPWYGLLWKSVREADKVSAR